MMIPEAVLGLEASPEEMSNASTGYEPDLTYLITQHLSTIDYPVTPYEIASSLNLNHGSVRSRLSKMVGKGIISRPRRGFYRLNIGHGLMLSSGVVGGPRVQNLWVVAGGVGVLASDEVVLDAGVCRVTIVFGLQRGKISYRVAVPLGLDLIGLGLVHWIVVREVEGRGYVVPEDGWMVKNVEFLNDYNGFKLEGFESCTFSGMFGELEKYYNRSGVRREVRAAPRGVRLSELRSLLGGGVDSSQMHRRLNDLEEGMRVLTEAVKGSNRLSQALLEAYLRRQSE